MVDHAVVSKENMGKMKVISLYLKPTFTNFASGGI